MTAGRWWSTLGTVRTVGTNRLTAMALAAWWPSRTRWVWGTGAGRRRAQAAGGEQQRLGRDEKPYQQNGLGEQRDKDAEIVPCPEEAVR